MNGKLQGIIICVVVILCLGGTLLFLNLTGGQDSDNSGSEESSAVSSQEEKEILIIDSSSEKINSVEISNENGKFTVERPASGKTAWCINELEGINQSQNSEKSLIENVAQLEAEKLVEENTDDPDKYGLKNPVAEFTVTFSDNSKRIFQIGDVTPEKSKYRYLTEKDTGKVYTVKSSVIDDFIDGKEQFIDPLLIESPEEVEFGTMTIKRPDIDYDITFIQDTDDTTDMMSAQIMVSPIYSYLNGSSSQNTTHGLWGLTADSAVCLFPDDNDKKEYGITSPTATVIYKSDTEDYKLYIGNPIYSKNSEGKDNSTVAFYYCYLEGVDGVDCIWKISAEDLPWADVMPEDIITTVMTYNNIADIDNIIVKRGSQTTKYTLTSEDDELKTAAIDGKKTDTEKFKTFYQYFLSCPTTEIWYKEPDGEKFMSVEIKVGNKTDILEFFTSKSSERKAIVKRNGKTSFRIPLDWTDKFVNNMESLEKGGEILTSY